MAAALYRRPPDAKQVGAFGFRVSDFDSKPVLVWPENVHSVNTFIAMHNRWHVGMSGRTAIDLSALDNHIWRSARVPRRYRRRVVDDLLVMEEAALKVIHAKG